MKATISPYLIKKIVNAEHHDPFSILGMHSVKMKSRKAIAVRAYCPDANNLYIIPQNELFEKREMNLIQDEGFFETVFEGVKDFFSYSLELFDRAGNSKVFLTPILFLLLFPIMICTLFQRVTITGCMTNWARIKQF